MPLGRPSIYSDALAEEICARIASGRSVVSVCRDDDMPHVDTVYTWAKENPDFSDRFTRAKEARAETLADRMLSLGEKAMSDSSIDPARIRAAVDAIDRAAGRMTARKVSAEVTGAGGKPLVPDATPERMAQALLAVIGRAASEPESGDA